MSWTEWQWLRLWSEHGGQKHEPLPTLAEDGADADANPYGEGVEGEDVGVVAFAWFVAGVVEVDVEDDAAEEEEQGHEEQVGAPPPSPLRHEARETQQEGEDEDHCAVVLEVFTPYVVVHQVAAVHVAELVGEVVERVVDEACGVGGVGGDPVGPVFGVALAPESWVEWCLGVLVALDVGDEAVAHLVHRRIGGCTDGNYGVGR